MDSDAMSGARSLRWEEVPSEQVFPGITRRIVQGERQSMVQYLYAPGAVFPRHAHPQEQVTLIVRGHIRFDFNGRSLELGPGGVAVIPGGVPHGATVIGDEEVESYNALSPRRETHPNADASHAGD